MSDSSGNDRDGQPRHFIGLLVGLPLLLFGLWLMAVPYPGFWSGRRGPPPEVNLLLIPGIALVVAGGYLIRRAR